MQRVAFGAHRAANGKPVQTSQPADKVFEIVLRFDTSDSRRITRRNAEELAGEIAAAAREVLRSRGINFQAVEGSWHTAYVIGRGDIDNEELRERPRRGRGVVVEADDE